MTAISPSEQLQRLGIELSASGPGADWHLPVADDDGILYVSGQVPFGDDGRLLHSGPLSSADDVEIGRACARQCAVHVLAQLAAAAGGLERVRLLKLTVFVASAPDFTHQPVVAHGASELLHAVLGDAGRHARSAVGVAALPLGASVEVEAIARVRAA